MPIQPELPASIPPSSQVPSPPESRAADSGKKMCTWDRRLGWVWVPVPKAQAD